MLLIIQYILCSDRFNNLKVMTYFRKYAFPSNRGIWHIFHLFHSSTSDYNLVRILSLIRVKPLYKQATKKHRKWTKITIMSSYEDSIIWRGDVYTSYHVPIYL